jgi:hypothetical protein
MAMRLLSGGSFEVVGTEREETRGWSAKQRKKKKRYAGTNGNGNGYGWEDGEARTTIRGYQMVMLRRRAERGGSIWAEEALSCC